MKLYNIFTFFLISFTSCEPPKKAEIHFDDDVKKFKVTKGEKFTTEFSFINSGNDSLKILSVNSSCGCTIALYPRYSIPPGHKDKIIVTYDSNTSDGQESVSNNILIESNTTPILHRLSLEGEVYTSIFDR